MRRRILERRPQRRVADQELRVRLVGLVERHMHGVGKQHLRQYDGSGRFGCNRDRAHALERRSRDQLDRLDRSLARDAEPRQQAQAVGVPRVRDRRDRGDVEIAGHEPAVQLGRHADDLLHVELEPVEDRRHVHVADAPEADQVRSCEAADLVVERVALHRDAAGVGDDAGELLELLLGARRRAGGMEDRLAHDGALDVVRAEVERDLGDGQGERDPVRLDVRRCCRAGGARPPAPSGRRLRSGT